MIGKIHSIETFGAVDGPGIRTVFFLQGCPARCLYCHNPDTWAVGRGTPMTAGELIGEVEKVQEFLKNGGITVSGGEPMLQQEFVKDNSMSVEQYVAKVAKEQGGSIKLKAAVRFEKGEGIEKKQENFAEEIAKMVK